MSDKRPVYYCCQTRARIGACTSAAISKSWISRRWRAAAPIYAHTLGRHKGVSKNPSRVLTLLKHKRREFGATGAIGLYLEGWSAHASRTADLILWAAATTSTILGIHTLIKSRNDLGRNKRAYQTLCGTGPGGSIERVDIDLC